MGLNPKTILCQGTDGSTTANALAALQTEINAGVITAQAVNGVLANQITINYQGCFTDQRGFLTCYASINYNTSD